ncbi:Paf1 domain containing protein [Klebsormidium nitens]|uniref:Paf1 domain containing protein n=1 Tax=Klebsormidium nitens TaxID=105231 RepID=A0A1Y1I9E3_KLENI|nr:Paf1 domain containing protein [Klebsormidium nitens]|eukprot:GAQ85316.1 Paf1 domain containing protein [Klebsormidium nitens]
MATTFSPPAKLPAEDSRPLQYGAPGRPELAQYPPPKDTDIKTPAEPPLQYGAPDQPGLAQYPPPNSSFYSQIQQPPPPPQPPGYPPAHAPYPGYEYSGFPYQDQYQYPGGYNQQSMQPPAHPQGSVPPPKQPAPLPPPPAAAAPGPTKKVETEEERKKRKEHERRKYEERKRAEQKKAAQQAAAKQGGKGTKPERKPGEAGKEQNRLKRPTNFVCRIKFRNELPEVLGEPKFLLTDLDPDRYTKYTITTLEKRYKHKLLMEPDLGIPLDLMDLSVYDAPPADQRPPMDPEDRALLQDDVKTKLASTSVIKKKDRPAEEGMKWLVRTSYISNIDQETTKNLGLNEKQLKQKRDEMLGLLEDMDGKTDREKQLASIEATFVAAQLPPVHASKPHLRPELVLQLLPDADRFDDPFVQAVFDAEPTAESERHRHYGADVREEMAARAMMKGFTIPGDEGQAPEKFIAYMVPSLEEVGADPEDREVEFDWVREYNWQLQPTESGRSTFVLNFEDDQVAYLPIKNGLKLKKRKARESRQAPGSDGEDDGAFRQPSRVTVQKRSQEEIEEDIRVAKIARIEEEERLEAEREERERQEEEARAARAAERAARRDSDDEDSPKRGNESGEEDEAGQRDEDED